MEAPMINGKPGVWISVSAAEKVNTGNFSNVDVGPISFGKWVEDTGEEGIAKEIIAAQQVVEMIVAEERQSVVEALAAARS